MKVNVMELRHAVGSTFQTTLLQVDNDTLITVRDFGFGGYRWKVENSGHDPEYNPMAIAKALDFDVSGAIWDSEGEFLLGTKTLGPALVWANPITFAHVVMDLINNQ